MTIHLKCPSSGAQANSLKSDKCPHYNKVLLPPTWPVCNYGLYRTAQGQWSTALLNINHVDFCYKIWGYWVLIRVLTHTVYLPAQQNYDQPNRDFSFLLVTWGFLSPCRLSCGWGFPPPRLFFTSPRSISVQAVRSLSTPMNACHNGYKNLLHLFLYVRESFLLL